MRRPAPQAGPAIAASAPVGRAGDSPAESDTGERDPAPSAPGGEPSTRGAAPQAAATLDADQL